MPKYELLWKNGTIETITGYNIADAWTKAGYSGGAMASLDFYREVKEPTIEIKNISGGIHQINLPDVYGIDIRKHEGIPTVSIRMRHDEHRDAVITDLSIDQLTKLINEWANWKDED